MESEGQRVFRRLRLRERMVSLVRSPDGPWTHGGAQQRHWGILSRVFSGNTWTPSLESWGTETQGICENLQKGSGGVATTTSAAGGKGSRRRWDRWWTSSCWETESPLEAFRPTETQTVESWLRFIWQQWRSQNLKIWAEVHPVGSTVWQNPQGECLIGW